MMRRREFITLLSGAAAYDFGGRSVASAGDVNGDGFDDVIVGAPLYNGLATDDGGAFIYMGGGGGTGTVDSAAFADGTFFGDQQGARAGSAVEGAGDVNGDGFADVIIGGPLTDSCAGDQGAARGLDVEAFGDLVGDLLDADAEPAAAQFTELPQ